MNILMFGIVDYETIKQRPQHLCEQFLQHGHEVFYFNPRMELAGDDEILTTVKHESGACLCFFRYSPFEQFAKYGYVQSTVRRVTKIIELLGNDSCIIYMQTPYWWKIAQDIKAVLGDDCLFIYEVLDNYRFLLPHRKIVEMHEQSLIHADRIVCTTRLMLGDVIGEAHIEKTTVVPNACDYSIFGSASLWDTRPQYPVIGYIGVMQEWMDWDILTSLLREPVTLELYGTEYEMPEMFRPYYGGIASWSELPEIMSHWSVGIIPHIITPLTNYADHIKLYEYMAVGLPVVMTGTAANKAKRDEIAGYACDQRILTIADGCDFGEACIHQSKIDDRDKRMLRKRWAKAQTWDARHRQILSEVFTPFIIR